MSKAANNKQKTPNPHASWMGRRGGQVTGACKARPEHARRIAMLRWLRVALKDALRDGDAAGAENLRKKINALGTHTQTK